MDSPLRFSCPECGNELKAPREYAGKRVRCTKPDCRHSFPIPAGAAPAPRPLPLPVGRDEDFDPAPSRPQSRRGPQSRARRSFPTELIWIAVALVVMGGSAFGVYWWVGQPTASQEVAYEGFIRIGNELVDLHEPISTNEQALAARPALRAKAEEYLQYWMQLHGDGRRGKALEKKFKRETMELFDRVANLKRSNKPLIVFIGNGHLSQATLELSVFLNHTRVQADHSANNPFAGKWEVEEFGDLADRFQTPGEPTLTASPSDPVEPPAPTLAIRDVTGKWDSPEFSLVIEADGKGMAGFDASAGGKLASAIGHYTVDLKEGRPHIAFALTAAEGMPKYEFSVLSKPTPDSLVVKELGDRIRPNPITMKRRAVAPIPKAEVWKDVPLPERDSVTRAVVCDAMGGTALYGGTIAAIFEEVPGGGAKATPILDNPGSFWFIGKGGLNWKRTKFPEGSIVAVDGEKVPQSTKGDHRALITSKAALPVYANRAADGAPIATVKAGARVELLAPDSDPKGIHKVRLLDGEKREGWIKGGWDELAFQQRVGGAAATPAPAPSGKTTDAALEGAWVLRSLYGVYTGRDKDDLSVNGTHKITVRGNLIEILGSVDGKSVGEKYTLELDPAATPKKYTIRSALNPDDTESGIYWVEKDTLLMRPQSMGRGVKDYTFSGVNISSQDRAGDDSAIPKGFLRKRGDPGFKVMRFERVSGEKAKPVKPEVKPEPKPETKAEPKAEATPSTFVFSELKITKTTFEPPSVEFTIRLDRAGGRLLEAWASVGVKDAGKMLQVFAGALYGGLLSVNGIDFGNPDPALKAQRVAMKPSAKDADVYECTVRYPKLVLDDSITEFTIVGAVDKDKAIGKTNAATVRVDLKTGKVLK